jgi:hypothetical protein
MYVFALDRSETVNAAFNSGDDASIAATDAISSMIMDFTNVNPSSYPRR